jgi:hypothetical protein
VFEFLERALRSAHRLRGLISGANPHLILGAVSNQRVLSFARALLGGFLSDVRLR